MYRVDRSAHGGGLMILIRNDICFHVITRFNIDMSSFRIVFESMLLKDKMNKPWLLSSASTGLLISQKASGNLNLVLFLKLQQLFQMYLLG